MRLLLRRAALVAVAAAFWVAALEGGARGWIALRGDALDRSLALLRADARLGWAQREDWRGRFLGFPVLTDEAGFRSPPLSQARVARRKILILGPSSAFGWGVAEEDVYARRLEALLRARRPTESVAVVNAGEIGYSAWQGLELYRGAALRGLRPDDVVVAYGANDPDLHRFFYDGPQTDAEALGAGLAPGPAAFQNALRRLALFRVGARAALSAAARLNCGRLTASAWRPSALRVPPADYADDLRRLVAQAREDGARPILMTTAFRFPIAPEPAPEAGRAARAERERGLALMSAGRAPEAGRAFARAVDADSTDCAARHALAAALSASGECAASRAAEDAAARCEPGRLGRDLVRYNAAVLAIARAERVQALDARALLSDDPAAEFIDPIHPSALGHRRIAEGLAALTEKSWNEKSR